MELKIYLAVHDKTVKEFAKEVDFNRMYISQVMRGLRIPGRKLVNKIEEATKREVCREDLMLTREKYLKKKGLHAIHQNDNNACNNDNDPN